MTIKKDKIKCLESMLSMAEEDKREQNKIIRKMTYNEVLKKACSDTEKKNINLESTVNCLKPKYTERDLKISTMECEINCKLEDIRRLDQQIKLLTDDLEDSRNKNSEILRQVRELQHQIKECDKKEEAPKRPNTGDRQTDGHHRDHSSHESCA
jgi:chromosome segregation ATPase